MKATLKFGTNYYHHHHHRLIFPHSKHNFTNPRSYGIDFSRSCKLNPNFGSYDKLSSSSSLTLARASSSSTSGLMASGEGPTMGFKSQDWEEGVEKVIYQCRFVTLLGVFGSLFGALLCFIKGCNIVASAFIEHVASSGKSMILLVEATDVYLLGTVMLVFGMGLYELFVCNLDIANSLPDQKGANRSNLFGLFTLTERPQWLEIKSVNELKTKVGHVIVMLLLIGLFDNSKKAAIHTPLDLLCFAASILLCSGCLYLLSKLNGSK